MDHSDMLTQGKSPLPGRGILAAVCLVTAALPSSGWSQQQQTLTSANFEVTQPVQPLEMLVKSSRIIRTQNRIPRFQVHNEELIAATPVAENEIQLYAKAPGTTQINLWDTDERQYTVDVTVVADARMVEGVLSSQLVFASLRVTPLGEGAVISGTVTSVEDVDLAMAIAEQFYPKVINNIKVVGVQQVLLHTKIMEVSRTKLRDLGIDWQLDGTKLSIGSGIGNLGDGILGQPPVAGSNATSTLVSGDFSGLLAALRRDNLLKLLAEPTVVATHGRPARFNVGGKIPYVIPSGNNTVTVAYEEYGTSVDFVPFVIGPGRIRLEVRPEVSEPDSALSIVGGGINVTAFTTRYVETSVEMQAGQTFAIAGLLQSRTESTTQKVPLLGEMPYVGSLFRRVRDRRNDVELLITVTPEFVGPMDPHEVPCGGPGLSTTDPTDKELYMKGYMEVPNLFGDCGCLLGESGPSFDLGPGAYEHAPEPVRHLPAPSDGLIYPAPAPTIIGPGVTVEGPAS